ncbi:MAG: hypothetical protein JOY54_21545 [Acidobacteriaceae bacterium]|nr:hypothetical protein [Acidobacteriaceae bacterium]
MLASATTRYPAGQRNLHKNRRFWIGVALVVCAVPAFYTIVFSIYRPFTEQNVIDVLQERSLSSVTIDRFQTTYFPPGCVAEGVKFLRIKRKDKPPLITIRRLVISASYPSLLTFQRRLSNVRMIGLHVAVPAKQPPGEPSPAMPLTYSTSKGSMPIDNLYADGAVLDFYRTSSPKPLRITVKRLAMHHVGANTAFNYSVVLYNSALPGLIQCSGSFGPWNPKNPGSTPVRGDFTYTNATLRSLKEVSGTLSSKGTFQGDLGRINAAGKARIPNFTLPDTSHQRPLAVDYQIAVDALDGDIELSRVAAAFNRTTVLISGSLSGMHGEPGRHLSLDVSSSHARIEDLLDLFISATQAPMSGNVSFHLRVNAPAFPHDFLQAMTMNGGFGIAEGKFSDTRTEQGFSKLSESAELGKRDDSENSETVLSGLKGQLAAAGGLARLSDVEFLIPGAHAWLDGTYNLLNYQTDLTGVLITTGDVSKTETGFKSFLLRALTPFFRHKGHAKVVPFKITGPYGRTNISLDLTRLHK